MSQLVPWFLVHIFHLVPCRLFPVVPYLLCVWPNIQRFLLVVVCDLLQLFVIVGSYLLQILLLVFLEIVPGLIYLCSCFCSRSVDFWL